MNETKKVPACAPGPKPLPELLCPAGSPEALDAAIEGGADAVYLGGPSFNARAHARNFTWDELAAGAKRAHIYGTKLYLTLNTQAYDKELQAYLDAAGQARACGVDGLIVADFGGAAAIRRAYPDLPLHASTQASGHSLAMARRLAELGYTRMVCARELSREDLTILCAGSPIEIEAFVHGALCVSHSGQCLFSSLVGGRSGNRGECAQPCRLPYGCGRPCDGRSYPMSLKDLSLAPFVPELIEAGVASLKIEGRMKSPEYVYGVAKIWRRLLDERRAATRDEMQALASLFSRGGFTSGYYEGKIGTSMLGIRSEDDKEISREKYNIQPFAGGISRRVPIDLHATVKRGEPIALEVSLTRKTGEIIRARVSGPMPDEALNTPLTRDAVLKNLLKFGGTPFAPEAVTLDLDEGLILPLSAINALRRAAVDELSRMLSPDRANAGQVPSVREIVAEKQSSAVKQGGVPGLCARFSGVEQITEKSETFFDEIALPLWRFDEALGAGIRLPRVDALVMPPVVLDRPAEREAVVAMIDRAVGAGIGTFYAANLGQVSLLKEKGLTVRGDFRFNICNSLTASVLEAEGMEGLVLSPELTLPQLRDVCRAGRGRGAIVYGRIPLMTLEKCLLKENVGCGVCARGAGSLTDRRGVKFPVLREFLHRNVVYNSVPTWMADRKERLDAAGIAVRHLFFTVESPAEVDRVIDSWKRGAAPDGTVRRVAEK